MADYLSAITGLAAMAAQLLAKKQKDKELDRRGNVDTRFDINMERAAELGYPGTQYLQQVHDLKTQQSRRRGEPVDYGSALQLLGKGLAGVKGGNGVGNGLDDKNMLTATSAPLPKSQLDYTPQLPAADKPVFDYGGTSSGASLGDTSISPPQLTAPNWDELDLGDDW